MSTDLQHPVVVGVDGTDQSRQAVRFAVQEARRHGCGVFLVHVIHETAPMAPMLPLISVETLEQVGDKIVADAKELVQEIAPDVAVETLVKPGSRTQVLCEVGKNARMIVLGHRERSMLGRVFTQATTTGVAARAHTPVVSVPADWDPERRHERVLVGLDGSAPSKDALGLGFQATADRGASLTVVHAWKLPVGYDEMVASDEMIERWMAEAKEQMEKIVLPWREVYPDVEVDVVLRSQFPAEALAEASEEADLVVIGRRGYGAPLGFYLGSIARALIREAHCPVEVAPHRRHHEMEAEEPLLKGDQVSPQA